MAAPRLRQPAPDNESSTRLKRADEASEQEDRSARNPSPPSGKVRMKIPRGMPPLPGSRAMPPLPVLLRASLAPFRRTLAPLRRSLTPFLGPPPSTVADASPPLRAEPPTGAELDLPQARQSRAPLLIGVVLLAATGVVSWWVLTHW